MRFLRFAALSGILVLSSIAAAHAQDADAPVFRSDTNVVMFEFGATVKRGLRGKTEPMTDVTIADMKVVIDRKEYAPTTMTQVSPGRYMLSLDIPEQYKNGKSHKVRFKIKKMTFPYTHKFSVPKPMAAVTPSS